MKSFYLLIVFFPFILMAQMPEPDWKKCFGGSNDDFSGAILATPDGGALLSGSTSSTNGDVSGNPGGFSAWVVKLDNSGAIDWDRSYGGNFAEALESIDKTQDNGFVLAGHTFSTDIIGHHGSADIWVLKIDYFGNIDWSKCLGGSGLDQAYSVKSTPDGGVIVVGSTESNDGDMAGSTYYGEADFWVVKLDNTGNITWKKNFGGSADDTAYGVSFVDDGYLIIGGTSSTDNDGIGNHGGSDVLLMKLNLSGVKQWQTLLGGSGNDTGYSISSLPNGNIIIGAQTTSSDGDVTDNNGNTDYWIVQTSSTGSIIFEKTYGGSNDDYLEKIQAIEENGYLVSGYTYSNNGDITDFNGGVDYWLVKLNTAGDLEWEETLGGTHVDKDCTFDISPNGLFVTGSSMSNNGDVNGNHGDNDYWVLKFNSFLSVNEYLTSRPSFYPNPAKDILFFRNLTNDSLVEITDISGKSVLTSSVHTLDPQINIKNLPSGVYFIKINHRYVSKLIKK